MNRFFLFLCCISLYAPFLSCKSTSPASSPKGLVAFGSGTAEDDVQSVNKSTSPSNIQKVNYEEALAKASVHEAEIDAKLTVFDYNSALSAFDSLRDVLDGMPAGNTKIQEVRTKIEKAFDSIVFESVSGPAETVAGTAFKKDFTARVSVIAQGVKKPLSGLACVVQYPSFSEDGVKITASQTINAGVDGLVVFTPPVPSVSGKNKLVISADFATKDSAMQESIAARKEKGQLAVAFPHVTGTNAKRLATTISILDYDKNGKAQLAGNLSATTLLKPLVQKGFNRIGMADFPNQLASGDEAVLIKAAKAMFGTGVQRFIFGTTRVESLVQGEDLLWSCTFVCQISVWDFTFGTKVYATEMKTTQTGKTEAAALDAARKKVCADLLVSDLYYNM